MSVLTAERLVKLAYNYPALHNTWYLVACAALTVVNQPNEIPKIFHFALRQQLLEYNGNKCLLTDKYLLQLAQDSINSSIKYAEFTAVGVNLPDILIPYTYYDKLPLAYKFNRTEDISKMQYTIASKFREVILKSAALSGLPKAINALMILKTVTPNSLRPDVRPARQLTVAPGHLLSSGIVEEDVAGTNFKSVNTDDTIDGPISDESINARLIKKNLARGSNFWNSVYLPKVNKRIRNQMFDAYPDLWYYAYHNVYAPLLSFTDILSAKETSMCVVSLLIPQDVNPQLKGHLKGAVNVGATKNELTELRSLVFDICDWTGGNYWSKGKESVAKL
jgi:alkylhydroperoxidase/carboxymuconolactone decarboxylase family protein YurZ